MSPKEQVFPTDTGSSPGTVWIVISGRELRLDMLTIAGVIQEDEVT